MANNQTHLVSPELSLNAQFKSIHAIPTNHLQSGDVIQLLPGTYDDPRTSNVADKRCYFHWFFNSNGNDSGRKRNYKKL